VRTLREDQSLLLPLALEGVEDDEDVEEELLSLDELDEPDELDGVLESDDDEPEPEPEPEAEEDVELGPFALALEARESLIYQPLPLNTMPTGWMILRKLPPHCSHVVKGGSEKLWRFSITSLQAVQVYV
jgi:hypothetical protein